MKNAVSIVYDNINDEDAELMDFANKIAATEFDEYIRNKLKVVQYEQDSV